MCGITGYYDPDKSTGIEAMTRSLAHRGPDASGSIVRGSAGLGHTRLSIVDLSEEANQPMSDASGRYTIIYNGEVYNFRELAEKYSIITKTRSDTEVILELFKRAGEKTPSLLNGMFALAIWDNEKEEFFFARDRLGIKPLFYRLKGNAIYFGSEIKPLAGESGIRSESIPDYLQWGFIPEPYTIYTDILKFPAGHFGWFRKGSLQLQEYWKAEDHFAGSVLRDEDEALNHLDSMLKDSVKRRLYCDVPYGTLLSGGTDSSLITAMAAQLQPGTLNTFTIGFEEQKLNEAPYARAIAKHLGTVHHEYTVTEKDALEYIPQLTELFDEPYADSSAIPMLLVSKMAAREVKMVLSGDGGDELFHGYGSHLWARRLSDPWIKLFRKPIAAFLSIGDNRQRRAASLFRYENQANIPAHIFSQEQYFFSRKETSLLTGRKCSFPEFHVDALLRDIKPQELQALFDLKKYLRDDLLVKTDRTSMKMGLEVRVPLLDYRIAEFSFNLDPSLKINGKTQKYLLKKLLERYIPAELTNRPKQGFAVPMQRWLKSELKPLMSELLSDSEIKKTGILDPVLVTRLQQRWLKGEDFLYQRIWNLMALQLWFRKHQP